MMRTRAAPVALALAVAGCAGSRPSPERPASVASAPRPDVAGVPTPFPPPPPGAISAAGVNLSGALSQGGMVIGYAPPGTTGIVLDGVAVPLSSDNRFLIAFGRDHGPAVTLVVRRADGTSATATLAIAPRAWRIEALPIPRGTASTPAFLAIRDPELAQIKAARAAAVSVDSDGWRQPFAWPVTGRVSGLFGAQRVYMGEKGSYHTGLDIAVPTGTPIRAPADGVVLLAAADAPFSLEGHLLIVGHGMGLDSAFLHLSHIDVAVGQRVRQGQVIGEAGMTGRATGPHLHWAMTWRGERIDPLLVVGAMPGG